MPSQVSKKVNYTILHSLQFGGGTARAISKQTTNKQEETRLLP